MTGRRTERSCSSRDPLETRAPQTVPASAALRTLKMFELSGWKLLMAVGAELPSVEAVTPPPLVQYVSYSSVAAGLPGPHQLALCNMHCGFAGPS